MQEFVVHPDIANLFRRWTPETKEANRKSFLENGIMVPIVVWRDVKGDWWVIDGANRFELWRELKKKGTTLELPANEFVGTEREALAHARKLNSGRRHQSASELAATAVTYHQLDKRMEAREQGLKLAPPPEGDQGGVADRLAEEWGVSRSYIYDCMKMREQSPEVLDKVRTGELNIPEGKIAVDRLAVGLPAVPVQQENKPATDGTSAKPTEAKPPQGTPTANAEASAPPTDSNVTDGAESEPDEQPGVVDGIGEPVPRVYEPAFAARGDFRKQALALKKVGEEIERMAGDGGGDYLRASELKADFRNLRRSILESQPFAMCPTCRGAKSTLAKCPVCKGIGYLDKLQWRLFAKENGKAAPLEEEEAAA